MKYNYTLDQEHAIETDASCFLLVGGAGTGKTHVFVERIFYLVHTLKLDPKHILILTSSVNELRNILTLLHERMDASNISLFTTGMFALKIILDQEGYYKQFINQDAFEKIKIRIIKDVTGSDKKYRSYIDNPNIFPNVHARIQEKLDQYILDNNISFEKDYIAYASKLLLDNEILRQQIIHQYSHIFIDHSQDIYGEEKKFIHLITHNTQSLFVLGNEDQATHNHNMKDTYLYEVYQDDSFEKVFLIDNYKTNQSILKFASIIHHNEDRILDQLKYMRIGHYMPDLTILSDIETMKHQIFKDIKELEAKGDKIEYDEIAIIVPTVELKLEFIKTLEEKNLLAYVDKPMVENHSNVITLLKDYIDDKDITKDNFFGKMLSIFSELNLEEERTYTKILNIYMKFNQYVSVTNFILFIQTKSYEKIYIKEPGQINILTLEETKGLDFKNVFICNISAFFTKDLIQSRRIAYNLLFTAIDHVLIYDVKDSHHQVLDELIYIKEHWNKIRIPKSQFSNIIIDTNKTYLRAEHIETFKKIQDKYKKYPKLQNELNYLIELINTFDKILNLSSTYKNIDIYMQAFRYFIQHTLKVSLDTIFDEKRDKIASYLSGGSAGSFNMDRDYQTLIKMNVLDKSYTKKEFKSIHDIYRYLSASHHKNDYTRQDKRDLKQASKNIQIYRSLRNRDKVYYFIAVVRLFDALNLTDKHLQIIEDKIE